MGNASAKEEGNGHMATSPPLVAGGGGTNSADAVPGAQPVPLSPPDALMLEQPPPVPYLFAPQIFLILSRDAWNLPAHHEREIIKRKKNLAVQQKGLATAELMGLDLESANGFGSSGYWVMLGAVHRFGPSLAEISHVPVAPLQRPTEFAPVFNHSPLNGSDDNAINNPKENWIPTLITWSQGGKEVFLEGSWDNWQSRRALERSGKDHTILLVLPSGIYHYRIIVDGELRCVPDLPHVTDERGRVANLLDVHDYVPESLDSVAEFEAPPSPEHSYDLQYPGDEEFAKEPPTLPPQLLMSVLGGTHNTDEQASKPQHVVLNHLFIEKGWGSQSLLALGVTHRFESKYVSFVLYKPLRR